MVWWRTKGAIYDCKNTFIMWLVSCLRCIVMSPPQLAIKHLQAKKCKYENALNADIGSVKYIPHSHQYGTCVCISLSAQFYLGIFLWRGRGIGRGSRSSPQENVSASLSNYEHLYQCLLASKSFPCAIKLKLHMEKLFVGELPTHTHSRVNPECL